MKSSGIGQRQLGRYNSLADYEPRRMVSSGMLRLMALGRTDVSDEFSISSQRSSVASYS
jgi:hypothetical protein